MKAKTFIVVFILTAACAWTSTGCAANGWRDPVAVEPRLRIENAGHHFRSIAYSSDGSRLLVGQWPRPRIWDARTGIEGVIFEGDDASVWTQEQDNRPAVFSHDDKMVAAGSYGEVLLFDADSGKLRATFEASPSPDQTIAFSRDGSQLLWAGVLAGNALVSSDREVEARAWNLATNELAWKERFSDADAPSLSPDGASLAYFRKRLWWKSSEVHLWDAATRGEKGVLKTGVADRHGVKLRFSADGRYLSVAETSGTQIRTTADGSRHPVLRDSLDGGWRWDFAFSPEGSFVAGGCNDCIKLWDEKTGEASMGLFDPQFAHTGDRPMANALAFSPDGRFVAAAMTDSRIRIWEVSQAPMDRR